MLVEATFCHPSALRRVAQARLDRSAAGARDYAGAAVRVRALVETPMVPGEDDVLRRLVDSSEDTVAGDDRCEAIATWLSQEKHPAAVVFVDAPTVADAVCEELETLLARPVARYPYGLPAFEGGGTEVLVCDRGAEDGLNLQYSASCVVHYDLPLSAHRIEQRIGRLDRMLALRKVRSVALVPAVGLARLWFECLDTGVRIFDDSSASLQYVIEEHIQRFASELLSEGPDAFRRLRALWSAPEDGLDAQRKRIRAQELLDSLEDDPIRRQVYEDLEDREYDDGDNGRRSPLKRETEAMLTESFRLKRRGQGRSIVHYAYRDHVLSGLDFERWFGAALNDQVPQQTRPVTFSRAAAVDEHTELVRMGHPLVDGLWEFTRYDDRGISFAMLRIRPVIKLANIPPLAFRFDYYVETDLTAAWAVIEDHPGTAVEALRRRADEAFPPQYKTIWISSELERLTDELAIMHLETPYGDEGLHHVGHDINIHAEDWEVLDEVLGITDWSGLCHLARDTSRRHFEDHVDLPRTCRTRVDELRERHRTVSAQMESRIASASSVSASERETLALEQALFEALVAGIENPYIRLDAVGAVVTMRDNPLVAGGRQ
jgi:ATP-dependent helicase HepA